MNRIDALRNGIIEKLLSITNKEYLTALYRIVENSDVDSGKVKLTEEQIVMLKMSENDIKAGKVISQEQLDKEDLRWLKEL